MANCPVRKGKCIRDRCAWWIEPRQRCALVVIAANADAVGKALPLLASDERWREAADVTVQNIVDETLEGSDDA